ncbi:MAG: DUF1385 domain-containing protein [Ruminococcaceae bacterium]|jgi:uncharacterized protein YqhQ|nr:DUF1385 domain-containing protein [Oscillospiraceae bacterium]
MAKKECKYSSVGGQALIEGIVMKGPKGKAMCVRLPDGTIHKELTNRVYLKDKYKIARIPLLRGVITFVETLIDSYGDLMKSAEISGFAEVEDAPAESKIDKWIGEHFGKGMMAVISVISVILSLALSVGIFIYIPSLLVDLFDKYITHDALVKIHPLLEGVIRIIIFVLYMWIVSKQKDIKRVFMYHGAEHKSIFCFENGLELTVENVRKQLRFHPRCGTSFIFVMLILSIAVSSCLVLIFPNLATVSRPLWIIVKLLVLPFVMGLGYEFIKYAAKHDNIFVSILAAPGLWMQRITTKEPTDDIIEVGIASLKVALYGLQEEEKEEKTIEEMPRFEDTLNDEDESI